jgi:hypothetical protein
MILIAANTGRKHPPRTAEWRRKQSEAHTGTHHTEEARRKISEAGKGRKMLETTKKAAWEARQKTFQYPEELVIKIKTDLQNGVRICDVSRKYDVSYDNVKAIKYGLAYRHVEIAEGVA